VTPLSCALPNRRVGGPAGSGIEPLQILPKTRLRSLCGSAPRSEEYFCSYGVNADYEEQLQQAGLRVCARGIRSEPRAVELPHHRFFIATLFQPQLSSRPEAPHPIWIGLIRAAVRFRNERSR
jgi:CTP synthase (UTP-ammonia lyase)